MSVTIGDETWVMNNNAGFFDGTFVQATSLTEANTANYAVFKVLTDQTLTISYWSPFWSGICGFQIIELPDPTLLLLR